MRDVLQILAVAALVLALGVLGWFWLGAQEGADPLVLHSLSGEVGTVRGGVRAPATEGQTLADDERLVTDAGGRAVLGIGEGTRLELGESSSLRVLGRGEEGLRLELEGGRIQATVRPEGEALAITALGRTVRTGDGDLAVGLSPEGVIAVESTRGGAELLGFGEHTALGPGQQVVATPDGGTALGPVPEALLLAVEWPDQELTREEALVVRGRATPGTWVSLPGGASAVAGGDGRFALRVNLQEGENAVEVTARDPMGRTTQSQWSVRRDSTGPTGEFEIPF